MLDAQGSPATRDEERTMLEEWPVPRREELDTERVPLGAARAQMLLVSSLIEIIDCDRRLQVLKVAFRAKLQPETWKEIIAAQAKREQTIEVALAVWDTAATFPRGTAADSRARQLLERNDSWTLDRTTIVRRPDVARQLEGTGVPPVR